MKRFFTIRPQRFDAVFSASLALLCCLPVAAWASGAPIKCHRDKHGVMNCTNVGTGKSSAAKPKVVATAAAVPSVMASDSAAQLAAVAKSSVPTSRTTLVYKYRQSNNVAMFTNQPQSGLKLVSTTAYQSFEKGWTGSFFKGNWKLNREAYEPLVQAMSSQHGVDPSLVRAVIHAESSFNPNAVSRTGAMGLMQLMPGTAERFGVGNAFDPEQNIRGGVSYLRFLLDKFNGDVRLAAAGYNAGEGAVMKYGGVPPYSETTQYVARVLDLHGQYRSQ